ncbi:MAG: glycerol kinase GlpK [Phormidesmis priestleyi Ana]|uniref:Glycerol kinase n=1 Tax=Phormidesmis priestleyi Ana TaxID=1666911 RepID=A0A0P7ZI48_9CYAN|nr:MAG: glycerol kinase GlpK [Phormidesmis priestleyi Ana]
MRQSDYIMALDLGTTGNRAIIFDRNGQIKGQAYRELTQHYPQPGWLEHDAAEIWREVRWAMQASLENAAVAAEEIAAIGLTVQRETCLLWDKTTGQPLHNAIVWQDRRTAPLCDRLRAAGKADLIYDKTGLILDAYFSATKLNWLLDAVKQQGINDLSNVLAGTIDSWVLWNLTGGQVHATDHSNASRTMLLNLATHQWDKDLLDLFEIPASLMPKVCPSLSEFGRLDESILGVEIPIMAILGDQQAALFAHGCDRPGLLKCTYGTGSFLVAHTGHEVVRANQLLSTIAWSFQKVDGTVEVCYALEGAIFTSGACIQWLRDGLKLIQDAAESEALACQVPDTDGVYFVPALSGLGAPHWDMSARGAFMGLTAGAQREHLVRAVLEAIAFQVKEVVNAANSADARPIALLKVDGGACNNNFLMQFQADALGIPVERPEVLDATAQGAAFAAGLASGFWHDYHALVETRKVDKVFEPRANAVTTEHFARWEKAVSKAKDWTT